MRKTTIEGPGGTGPCILLGLLPLLLAAFALAAGLTACAARGPADAEVPAQASLRYSPDEIVTSLIAGNLEMDLLHLSASIRSLGEEYARVYEATPFMAPEEQRIWAAHAQAGKKTTAFFLAEDGREPAYQSSRPAFLAYGEGDLAPEAWRELAVLHRMAPLFRLGFETFDYSWVYISTAKDVMAIYPYLPLADAVNNYPPTGQVFYAAADFAHRGFGWTEPYLDLVGAGMMVTVSWPVYSGDALLGVASRDITLDQLGARVLAPLAGRETGLVGLIVDKNGLAIASSDKAAMDEVDKINEKAGAAVLHYRTGAGMAGLPAGSVASSFGLYNQACEEMLAHAGEGGDEEFRHAVVESGGSTRQVTATGVGGTGWQVILLSPVR